MKVLGIGDNVCDVYVHQKRMYPGGQALNFAVNAKMLGAESEFLGVFGTDLIAACVKQALQTYGIPFPRSRTYPGDNGYARVTLDHGERVFLDSNKGGVIQTHPLRFDREDLDYIADFFLVHTTNNGFLDNELPKLRQTGVLLSYDFSYRWTEKARLDRVCPYLDFAFLSCAELTESELEKLCHSMHARGVRFVCATRGSNGAVAFDGIRFYRQPADYVYPVDTMGAGDAFATAFLVETGNKLLDSGKSAWLDHCWREEVLTNALQHAAAFSAKACLRHGSFDCARQIPAELSERLLQTT